MNCFFNQTFLDIQSVIACKYNLYHLATWGWNNPRPVSRADIMICHSRKKTTGVNNETNNGWIQFSWLTVVLSCLTELNRAINHWCYYRPLCFMSEPCVKSPNFTQPNWICTLFLDYTAETKTHFWKCFSQLIDFLNRSWPKPELEPWSLKKNARRIWYRYTAY